MYPHVHVYVYTHTYIHICIYVYMYVYIYIYVYTYISLSLYIYTYIHTYPEDGPPAEGPDDALAEAEQALRRDDNDLSNNNTITQINDTIVMI